jgi:hypothetical protein
VHDVVLEPPQTMRKIVHDRIGSEQDIENREVARNPMREISNCESSVIHNQGIAWTVCLQCSEK